MLNIKIDNMKTRLILLIFLIVIVSGCKKETENGCVETYLGEINLSQNEKQIIPYQLDDSLVFINESNNNVLLYKCTFKVSNYYTDSENIPDTSGNLPCLGNYYKKETYITQFNEQPSFWIRIYISKPSQFDTLDNVDGLRIALSIPGDSIALFDGEYAFNADSIFTYPHLAGPYVANFYDTVSINGKIFHNVYNLIGYRTHADSEYLSQLLYSISDGIIRFTSNKNKSWSLEFK